MSSCEREVRAICRDVTGRLRLFKDRIEWITERSSLIILISQIQVLHVNPPTVEKVLLKITPVPTSNLDRHGYLFNFAGTQQEGVVAIRDSIKDFIARQLSVLRNQPEPASVPSHPEKSTALPTEGLAQSHIDCRKAILSRDPKLFAVYRELVMSSSGDLTIGEADFWVGRERSLGAQSLETTQSHGLVAISSDDLRPSDAAGRLKFTLTPKLVQSIFTQFPAVEKAYAELVPAKLGEREFWSNYLTSKYFSSSNPSNSSADSIFKDFFAASVDGQEPADLESLAFSGNFYLANRLNGQSASILQQSARSDSDFRVEGPKGKFSAIPSVSIATEHMTEPAALPMSIRQGPVSKEDVREFLTVPFYSASQSAVAGSSELAPDFSLQFSCAVEILRLLYATAATKTATERKERLLRALEGRRGLLQLHLKSCEHGSSEFIACENLLRCIQTAVSR